MKNAAVWLYFVLYATLNMSDFADPETRGGPTEVALNVVLFLLASVGMMAYVSKVDSPRLLALWKMAAPLILVGYVVSFSLSGVPPDPALSADENVSMAVFAIAFSCLLLAPAVLINFRVAQKRHLA